MAYAGTHRLTEAQTELETVQAAMSLAPKAASFDGPPDVEHVLEKTSQTIDADNLKIAAAILGSRIAEARKRKRAAIDLMRHAVKLQDETPYTEPPPWFYPVRESLGALLLREGQAGESEKVFGESLRRSPNNPRSLLGLSAALRAEGRTAEAKQARAEFDTAWQHSDSAISAEQL
jgi:predicted Zn-dependent protease